MYETPPALYADIFDILQVFRSLSEDVHLLAYNPQIILPLFVPPPEGQSIWHSVRPSFHPTSCVCNSPNILILILLKPYRCLRNGLTIFILVGYSPQIIFFSQNDLSHFSGQRK